MSLLTAHPPFCPVGPKKNKKVETIREAVAGAEALCICEDLVAVSRRTKRSLRIFINGYSLVEKKNGGYIAGGGDLEDQRLLNRHARANLSFPLTVEQSACHANRKKGYHERRLTAENREVVRWYPALFASRRADAIYLLTC